MGQMRFRVPRQESLSENAVQSAYLAGMDGIPWRAKNTLSDGLLVIERSTKDSGNLYVPWNVSGHGEMMLSTTCLMEREASYHLDVELARGTLNRVRNQAADWQLAGMSIPEQFSIQVRTAANHFVLAATSQNQDVVAAEHAAESIRHSVEAIDLLGREFIRQSLAVRHQQEAHFSTLLAGHLESRPLDNPESELFSTAFNTASIPFNWRLIEANGGEYQWDVTDQQIQWARSRGLKVCGGPLVQLEKASLPDWLYLWEDDYEDLTSYVVRYVDAAVRRYQGKVQLWHCTARLNRPGSLALTEEQRLRLAVNTIEAVRHVDPRTPVILSFDQPWAEYLARSDSELSPIHFADALARADLGIAGIGLEINFGYWPGGSFSRDLLELSRQIDRWSMLGLPLLVLLTAPSSDAEDPRALQPAKVLAKACPGTVTAETQRMIVQRTLLMLLSKRTVHGIIWNQFSDADAHDFPHGGLLDGKGQPKPALNAIASVRQTHLK